MNTNYDQTNPQSILDYAKKLVGNSLKQAIGDKTVIKRRGKGGLGQDVEEYYFGLKPNNNSPKPDFPEAGVELKTFPLKYIKGKRLVAKERVSLGMIDYNQVAEEEWDSSGFIKKNSILLLLAYLYEKDTGDYLDYLFKLAELWRFPLEDLRIIHDDWIKIRNKIREGKAHELSEGDTFYLGAVTKSADSSVRRGQPFGDEPAKPRAFSLKQNYVNVILAKLLSSDDAKEIESAVKSASVYKDGDTFESLIVKRFEPYLGNKLTDLGERFATNQKAKNFTAVITNRILGVKTRKVEEFEKAGVMVKSIRLNRKGIPEEAMSFPFFRFKELAKEEWESSVLRESFMKKFFFVIYKKDEKGEYRLYKVKFWTMPMTDLNGPLKKVWDNTKRCVISGIPDCFTKSSESSIAHIRPHGRNAADTDELPNGKKTTKRSFWLNIKYIEKIV